MGGRLVFDGTCFYLNGRGANLVGSLVWPPGYSARSSPPRILDEHGDVVVRAGQIIGIDGSLLPLSWGPQVAQNVRNPQCTKGAQNLLFILGVRTKKWDPSVQRGGG
ncbi:MAG: hypothetical protein ACRDNW_22665 [Trebonia sp.]